MYFLFDFDGTIADSFSLTFEIHDELKEKYDLKSVTETDFQKIRKLSAQEIFKYLGLSAFKLPFFLADVRALTALKIKSVQMIPGLKETLVQLKTAGHHLSIVTSNSQENVSLFLEHHQCADLFDFVHSETNIWGKAAALKNVLKTKKIPLTETYYIGDEIRDILAAHEAGLRVISVTWGMNDESVLREHRPEALITQPAELFSLAS